jgi:hypothetical protein
MVSLHGKETQYRCLANASSLQLWVCITSETKVSETKSKILSVIQVKSMYLMYRKVMNKFPDITSKFVWSQGMNLISSYVQLTATNA